MAAPLSAMFDRNEEIVDVYYNDDGTVRVHIYGFPCGEINPSEHTLSDVTMSIDDFYNHIQPAIIKKTLNK